MKEAIVSKGKHVIRVRLMGNAASTGTSLQVLRSQEGGAGELSKPRATFRRTLSNMYTPRDSC